ncbi:MAG: tryptophan synthase subunit alpha [Actinobacteria bacterium RBG_16_68_21]|nr:MAG: tryptophan synthase subunit alpha [Actinobacteria bacterium RBG_16_68_21]
MSLGESFARAGTENRALLLPYGMAGLPGAAASVELFAAMAEAGADGFEVGIPYADPLMDGPVIQEAGARAIAGGMTLAGGLEVASQVAERTGLPCFVMTYVNPILRMGVDAFSRRAAAAGVQAIIVADLPVDEAGPFREAAAAAGIGVVAFAAPTTTDDRLDLIAEWRPPFVYGIAEMGVTGERAHSSDRSSALVERIRARTDVPVVLGVGISGPEAARRAASIADGVIVGSALVRRVLQAENPGAASTAVSAAVAELASAVRR